MRRQYRSVAIAGALCFGARLAHSQLSGFAEVGAASIDQAAVPASGVSTAGVGLRAVGDRGMVAATVLGVRGSDGRGTAQGAASASVFVPWFSHSLVEITALGSAFSSSDQLPVSALEFGATGYHQRGGTGVYYGVGGGASYWNAASLPVTTAQTGGWWARGPDRISVGAAATFTHSEFRTATGTGEVRTVFEVRYADATLDWRRQMDRVTMTATAGSRHGIDNVPSWSGWLAANASYALVGGVSVVGAAGQSPADFVRGVPQSRYVSVALRVGSGETRSYPARHPTAGPTLSIDGSGEHHVVHARVVGGSQVEIMGDFTEWKPVMLSRGTADEWSVEYPMTTGLHRVMLRVDGGAWIVPRNLTRGRDDFGGLVGLITVL